MKYDGDYNPDRPDGILPHSRIAFCELHRVHYNSRTGDCPVCVEIARRPQRPAEAKVIRLPGAKQYTCRYCGGSTFRKRGVCSRYECKKRSGELGNVLKFTCDSCGGRTKYKNGCSKLKCRRKHGTISRYVHKEKRQPSSWL